MTWVGLISGLNILDIKDAICFASRVLMIGILDILENWTTHYPMLGRGNPKDLLTNSELIMQMTQDPSDDKT